MSLCVLKYTLYDIIFLTNKGEIGYMIQVVFGNRIKELRNELLISQIELSNRSGIERAQISKIEQGKINVTLETIEKLSLALNTPINQLMTIKKETELHPFVKWAGGKTQILNKLKSFMPKTYNTYYEPFIGGGALLLDLAPCKASINDMNEELICVYKCLCDDKLYNEMVKMLIAHENNHSEEYFYKIREMDREESFTSLPLYERAARMIYLNKSCFNGLYRVNSKGYYNVPFGKKDKVVAFDRENLNNLHNYFLTNDITITNLDFEQAVKNAKAGDFVYFDPPYDTLDDKDSFTAYAKGAFGKKEQKQLAELFKKLSDKGVYVMLSNHNTSFIRELYEGFNINVIEAKRMINSKGSGRGNVEEVIITNY